MLIPIIYHNMIKRISLLLLLLLGLLHCQLLAALPQLQALQPEATVELDQLICPSSCVCQYGAFKELPIARWINHMSSVESADDVDFLMPTHIKLVTCLIQATNETETLLSKLPIDLQALILLPTGSVNNQLTVSTSSLRTLNQLTTLEIRGTGDITLIIDEPLEFLQHANFEQVRLQASERLQRPKYSKLPSDDYEYKPPSDVTVSDAIMPTYQLQFEANAAEQIVSYEQHVELLKQTRMPSFWGWSRLEVLRIHNCQLNELHWQMFDGLTQLHHLSLERNGIEELQPFAFSGAPHLKSLSLAHNAVRRLFYLGLAGLLELEALNLADNHLKRLSESSFPPLPRLQKADLRQNPIMYILPATFWVTNDTRELQLGSKQAALELHSWNSYGQFDSLHKLRVLSLSNVTATSLEQGVFKGLQALEQLKLRGSIGSVQFDAFAGMEQLRELDLSHCGIAELSMDALMGIKSLKILNLAYNNLTQVPHGMLDEQQQLEEVQLQGNQLRTLPTSFFLLPRLQLARLDQNPWQCSCDMHNWLQRLTNVVRSPSVLRCVRDMYGQNVNCRPVANFEMDKSLVPRCANYNGRSVYYVMRKQLQCGGIKILTSSRTDKTRGLPHWRKLELQQQHNPTKFNWQQAINQQNKNQLNQRNNLESVLGQAAQQQQHQQHQQQLQQQNEVYSPETDAEQMSNEIY